MRRFLLLVGAAGPAVGALGVAAAAYINRDWWDPRTTSVSHLGRYTDPVVSHPEILNISLILCALLTAVYTAGLLAQKREEKVPLAGPLMYLFGFIFLALVGVFPSGTPSHYPASIGFFLLTQAAVLAFAVTYRQQRLYALISITLFLSGALSFYVFLGIWEGDGMGELSWIATLLLWHYMTLRHINQPEHISRSQGAYRPGPAIL